MLQRLRGQVSQQQLCILSTCVVVVVVCCCCPCVQVDIHLGTGPQQPAQPAAGGAAEPQHYTALAAGDEMEVEQLSQLISSHMSLADGAPLCSDPALRGFARAWCPEGLTCLPAAAGCCCRRYDAAVIMPARVVSVRRARQGAQAAAQQQLSAVL